MIYQEACLYFTDVLRNQSESAAIREWFIAWAAELVPEAAAVARLHMSEGAIAGIEKAGLIMRHSCDSTYHSEILFHGQVVANLYWRGTEGNVTGEAEGDYPPGFKPHCTSLNEL